jgi:hypothetical protein
MSIFDWSKTTIEEAPFHTYAPVTRTEMFYAPQTSIQYPDYNIIYGSPESRISTKKELRSEMPIEYVYEEAPMGTTSAGETNIASKIVIAIGIVGVAWVATSIIGRKK